MFINDAFHSYQVFLAVRQLAVDMTNEGRLAALRRFGEVSEKLRVALQSNTLKQCKSSCYLQRH